MMNLDSALQIAHARITQGTLIDGSLQRPSYLRVSARFPDSFSPEVLERVPAALEAHTKTNPDDVFRGAYTENHAEQLLRWLRVSKNSRLAFPAKPSDEFPVSWSEALKHSLPSRMLRLDKSFKYFLQDVEKAFDSPSGLIEAARSEAKKMNEAGLHFTTLLGAYCCVEGARKNTFVDAAVCLLREFEGLTRSDSLNGSILFRDSDDTVAHIRKSSKILFWRRLALYTSRADGLPPGEMMKRIEKAAVIRPRGFNSKDVIKKKFAQWKTQHILTREYKAYIGSCSEEELSMRARWFVINQYAHKLDLFDARQCKTCTYCADYSTIGCYRHLFCRVCLVNPPNTVSNDSCEHCRVQLFSVGDDVRRLKETWEETLEKSRETHVSFIRLQESEEWLEQEIQHEKDISRVRFRAGV